MSGSAVEPSQHPDDVPASAGSPTAPPRSGSAARTGLISLGGFCIAAVCGFALTLVVSRGLGPAAAGIFFSAVAVSTVLSVITKLGADTGVVWALPRAAALGRTQEVRATVAVAVVPVLVLSTLAAALLYAGAPLLARSFFEDDVVTMVPVLRAVAPFVLAGGVLAVLCGVLRGLGDVVGYTAVQNIGVPVARALLAAMVLAGGAGVLTVTATWTVPCLAAVVLAALAVRRRLHRVTVAGPPPRPELRGEFWRFAAARSLSSVLEVLLVWSDVLLVAALSSVAEAGVYAAASRFITTGTLAEAAMRVAFAPRASALLAVEDLHGAGRLQTLATTWIVLLSWPLYLVLAVLGPYLLGIFGDEFRDGAVPLSILAVAMLVATAAGNSQTLLLMSGRSGWQMIDKAGALCVNLTLCWLLIPRFGMTGAACAWAVTIALDSTVVWLQVRYLVGVRGDLRPCALWMLRSVLLVGVPAVLTRTLLGLGTAEVAGCLAVAGLAYAWAVHRHRAALQLDTLLDRRKG